MLPAFMHFYPGLSRDAYYALTVKEFRVLHDYLLARMRAVHE